MKLCGICFSGTRDGESINTGSGLERLVYNSLQIVESGWTEFGSMMRSQDHSIRCWLRSHVQGRPYKAAFQLPGRCNTRKRYRWFWKSMMYFVLRLWRLDNAVRKKKLGLSLSTKQSKTIQELWTFLSAEENAANPTAVANAPDYHPAPDDDQSESSLDEDLHVGQSNRETFDKSATTSHAEMQRKTFDSSDSGESSDRFEPSTTEESDDSEDEGGLIQRSHPTKPGESCFLSCGFSH